MAGSRSSSWALPNIEERPYTRFAPLDPEKVLTKKEREEAEAEAYEQVSTPDQRREWWNLVQALRLHRRKLLRIPGVTAVDIGYKVIEKKNNLFENTLALRVHVERKLHNDALKPYEFIKPDDYPGPYGLVEMDIVQANYKLVQLTELPRPRMVIETPIERGKVNRRRRIDPLVGGISIGSPMVPVGTLGALVWDRTDGSICILSNWHVLAGDFRAEVGTPCFQPGLFDQGHSTDVVARLKRWSFNRQTDAAIAQLTGSRHYSTGEILSMFQTIKGTTRPHLGMKVRKSGRSTGFTWGFIDGLYFSAAIDYGGGVVRVFEEQIHIAPLEKDKRISEPGDSGSVWVADDPDEDEEGYLAVGLHFAGDLPHSAFGEYALANPMNIVEERLNISFRPLFLEIRDEDVVSRPIVQRQQNGNGMQPAGFAEGGMLTGPGGEPVGNPFGPGG